MNNPLVEIQKFGQSIWYDNISRDLITSGDLAAMIEHDGVMGVTSNPAIFEKAISGSRAYDSAIAALVHRGVDSAQGVYEQLAIDDIQQAADVLLPVYTRTDGIDGYVSLEVSPHLAHDTQATIDEARRLRSSVGRPNVMIKVPATPAGIPAIAQLIGEGINVNVTLLFAIAMYEQAAEAFMTGIEQLISSGGDARRVASVASFFVSRIDTMVDEKIAAIVANESERAQQAKLQSLMGKVATANAKLAYARYREIYASERWKGLATKGARPQRLLWASTSTKNPSYAKTMYVGPLIGPETVNTLPAETVAEFREHGRVHPGLTENWDDNVAGARQTMRALAEAGISIDRVTDALLADGVKKFCDPFDKLLASIAGKCRAVAAEREDLPARTRGGNECPSDAGALADRPPA